jgi:5-methylcytosine-specific restriction endonuclease McrA
LREGIFEHRCANCRNTRWLNQPIPLELDHINGNNKDNRLKNLRLLCPNCHAQTPTYRSKKRSKT